MCMPLAAQTAEQERVVPTTQVRLTPPGQEQQGNVREEDVETTEGEGVHFLGELLELSGWTLVDDDETEPDLP